MKWLDKIILNHLGSYKLKVENIEKYISELKGELSIYQNKQSIDKEDFLEAIVNVNKDILFLKEDIEMNYRRIGLRISENERLIREDMEMGFTGLTKQLNKKLDLLGDRKGIVTDLLKRIAELEGLVEGKHV